MLNGASSRSPTMSWLPAAPDFRGDLRAALDQAKPTDRLEGLAALAGHRLGFLETVQLDRALARLDMKEASGFQTVRLAILSSSTVDHLPPAIRVAGLRRRLLIEVHSGSYGQYRQDLLDSELGAASVQAGGRALLALGARSDRRRAPRRHVGRSRCGDRAPDRRIALTVAQGARNRRGGHPTDLPRRERTAVRRL